jgi:hypothetical protein
MARLVSMAALALSCLALAGGLATAGTTEQAAIRDGCVKSLNWTAAACQCFADKAGELNDGQQGFLAATLNDQKGAVAEFAVTLPQSDIMAASMFPTKAGPACQ